MATQSPTGGSCLCGKVKFALTGGAFTSIVCHCINCQKVTGSAFAANAMYKKDNYQILSGQEYIKGYTDSAVDSGNVLTRSFCSNCGSSLSIENTTEPKMKDSIVVMTGTIDGAKENYAPKREYFDQRKYHCVSVAKGSGKL